MSVSQIDNLILDISNINLEDNLDTTLVNIDLDMATLTAAKEIARTLKTFSGKSEHLEFFIASVDSFYQRYFISTQDDSLKEFVFASICSKICDEAGDFLLCRPDLTTWPLIKAALRQKFGDRVNRSVLSQQLNFMTKNRNESVLDFIERLKVLKTRISLKIIADLTLTNATKQALIEQTELTSVTVLISNSPSELRTILMFHNPKTLEDASTFVVNYSLVEQQINARSYHSQPKQQPQFGNKPHFQHKPVNRTPHFVENSFPAFENRFPSFQPSFVQVQPHSSQNFNAQANFKQPFPSQPINIQSRPVKQHFPTNSQVFGKPKNVFSKENSNRPTGPPIPMSTSTRNTMQRSFVPQSRNFNNFQRPKYTFTELTYLADGTPVYAQDQSENPDTDYTQYESPEYCSEPQQYYEPQYFEEENAPLNENENFQEPSKEINPP